MGDEFARMVVVGTSGAGKTTLARQLGARLAVPAIELDTLYWDRDWKPRPEAEFRRLTLAATAPPRWVVDGNYAGVRDIVWPRASLVVWLDLAFATVFARTLARTVRRIASGERLYAGNRESLRRAFAHRDSILLWVITTFRRRRREYHALRASAAYPRLAWVRLRNSADVRRFLADVAAFAQQQERESASCSAPSSTR